MLCHCRLSGCHIGETGCKNLALALESNPAHLRELDLSFNHPGESALELLSAAVNNPHWKLETLKYSQTHSIWHKHFPFLSFNFFRPPPGLIIAGAAELNLHPADVSMKGGQSKPCNSTRFVVHLNEQFWVGIFRHL